MWRLLLIGIRLAIDRNRTLLQWHSMMKSYKCLHRRFMGVYCKFFWVSWVVEHSLYLNRICIVAIWYWWHLFRASYLLAPRNHATGPVPVKAPKYNDENWIENMDRYNMMMRPKRKKAGTKLYVHLTLHVISYRHHDNIKITYRYAQNIFTYHFRTSIIAMC